MKKQSKYVTFNDIPKVYVMVTWNYAYRQYRKPFWEIHAIDRMRFLRRIHKFEKLYIETCLTKINKYIFCKNSLQIINVYM